MNDPFQGPSPPVACIDCRLGKFAIYGPTQKIRPNDISTRRRGILSVQAGKTFVREGEKIRQIYTLHSGWAFSFKQSQDGRRQILSLLIPGDAIILESLSFAGLPAPFSVRSLTHITMCVFDLQDMIALTKSPGSQAQRLAAAMWEQVESVSQRLVDVGRRSALGRIAQFILQLELRLRSRQMSVEGSFDFPVRQEHMADALGLTTVYVNRTLDRLRRLEIIQFNRNRMTVRNFEALRDIAELE